MAQKPKVAPAQGGIAKDSQSVDYGRAKVSWL
jgi:hypothetical protein